MCVPRLRSGPEVMFSHFGVLLAVDHERIHLWLFARVAVGLFDDELVRALAP